MASGRERNEGGGAVASSAAAAAVAADEDEALGGGEGGEWEAMVCVVAMCRLGCCGSIGGEGLSEGVGLIA